MLMQGAADAMNEVAWCYLEGFGCKKDKVRKLEHDGVMDLGAFVACVLLFIPRLSLPCQLHMHT